jgi:hypothetical protein
MTAPKVNWSERLPKDVARCLLNWGDKKTPIPDSLWHGRYRHFIQIIDGFAVILTPEGKAARAALGERE